MTLTLVKKYIEYFLGLIWNDGPDKQNKLFSVLLFLIRLLFVVVRDMFSGLLKLQASSLSFATLLALTPFLALVFSILKTFGVHKQAEPFLIELMQPLGERGVVLGEQVISYIENIDVGILGVLGFVMLFYLSISMMRQIEKVFNQIWHVESGRNIFRQAVVYALFIVLGSLSFFGAITITAYLMSTEFIQGLWQIQAISSLGYIFNRFVPYLFVILALTLFYIFIPNVTVKPRCALAGGAVAGLIWQTTGTGFAYFVVKSVQYQALYSSFAIVVLFLLWLYISWIIILIGTSITFYLQNPQKIVWIKNNSS